MDIVEEIFFARNKLAITILKELNEREWMAKTLSQKLGIYRETISRILTRLSGRGYVIRTKPDSSNFRPYKITLKGKRILKQIVRDCSKCKTSKKR
jgi:DNA-binding MarR family transcriptional regulator